MGRAFVTLPPPDPSFSSIPISLFLTFHTGFHTGCFHFMRNITLFAHRYARGKNTNTAQPY